MKKSLYFKDGVSDKVYHIQVVPRGDDFSVDFQYGRRNSTLQEGTKTPTPVSKAEAEKIFIKLANEKIRKGYQDGEEGGGASDPEFAKSVEVVFAPQLLNEVQDPEKYINDDEYLAQEKFDGERRMVQGKKDGAIGVTKKGEAVSVSKVVLNSLTSSPMLIDGEIVGDTIHAFDIVQFSGNDISTYSLIERLKYLGTIPFGKNIVVVPTAYTTKEKVDMFYRIKDENGEGIVFKKKNAPYTHGRPNSGGNALKFKFHKTGTFIVVGSTPGKRSVGLEMINEHGERRFMGKVTIPANKSIPETGDFVEVRYLYAYRDGAIFQPVYLDKRTDADLTDCETKQLIYKKD